MKVMKSLQESLFDNDLVSKETGYEYLYGLVEKAAVSSDFKIDYLDEQKIKRKFNEVMKKFTPQQWSDNRYTGMNSFQKMDMNELLRELLYIVVCSIKTSMIPFTSDGKIDFMKFKNIIKLIIDDYLVSPEYYKYVGIMGMGSSKKGPYSIRISFQLGENRGRFSHTVEAAIIRININTELF